VIDELLEAWRTTRDPRIEAEIVRLGRGFARGMAPLPQLHGARLEKQWHEILATAPAAELDHLLDVEWPLHQDFVRERVRALARLPPDPRIARKVIGIARRFAGYKLHGIYDVAAPVLVRNVTTWLRPWLDALYDAVNYREVSAAVNGLIRRGVGMAHDELAPLWAQVYAEPANLDHRSVLADALIARDDPRGEFIQLQLVTDPDERIAKRIARLWRIHRSEFIGPLPTIAEQHVEFANGFITALEAHLDCNGVLHRPEWRTLEKVAGTYVDMRRLLPNLPLVTHLEMGNEDLTGAGPFPSVRVLAALNPRIPRGVFPNLRVLVSSEDYGPPLAAELGVVLAIRGSFFDLAGVLQARHRGPAEIRIIERETLFLDGLRWCIRAWRETALVEFAWCSGERAFPRWFHEQLVEAGLTQFRVRSPVAITDVPDGIEVVEGTLEW
jgi:uncharacterized protein (TIGR02996 family)